MEPTENIRNVECNELQWNGFFSDFALVSTSVVVSDVQEENVRSSVIMDSAILL